MARFFKFLRWLVLVGAVLAVIVVAALALYTRTDSFHRFAREQILSAVNGSIRGSISLGRVEGSLWRGAELHDIEAQYQGKRIAHIPDLRISYSLLPLLWGRLEVVSIEALRPSLALAQNDQGEWNIAEAFRPKQETESESGFVVLVNSFALRHAAVDLSLANRETKVYRLRDLDLQGQLSVRPAGLSIDLNQVAAALSAPDLPALNIKAALSYDGAEPETLQIRQLWLVSRGSRLKLDGRITKVSNLPDMKAAAQLTIDKLAPSDIEYFVPQWPIKHDLKGSIKVAGPMKSLALDFTVAALEAKLAGALTANLAGEVPNFNGTIRLAGINPKKLLDTESFGGIVSGAVEVRGSGFALAGIDASGKIKVQSTQVGSWALGDLLVQGGLRDKVARLDATLRGGLGGAELSGKIELTQIPRYDVNVALSNLDVKKLSGAEITQGGKLNLKGTVSGSGIEPTDMNARADVRILPSIIGPVEIREGVVQAALADGRIKIAQATLRAKDANLEVRGDLGTKVSQRGNLDYRLQVIDLAPWFAVAGREGKGSANLKGSAEGSLTQLKTRGNLTIRDLQFAGLAVAQGNVGYELERDDKRTFPVGALKTNLTGVKAGIELRRLDGSVNFLPGSTTSMRIALRAEDQHKRPHGLNGTVDLQPSEIVARLQQVSLSLPDGRWQLARPAVITGKGNAILIDGFELRSGSRRLSVNGRFAMAGKQALNVSVDKLSLESLTAFMPEEPKLTGTLAVDASLRGTAAAPEINASARLTDATIAGQTYAGMAADGTFRERKAEFKLAVRQDANHTLEAQGTLPVALSWNDGLRYETLGDGEIRARSKQLSLAFLNAFSGKSVTDITGEVSLDLVARRIFEQPVLSGTFQLSDGKLNAVPLGVKVTDLSAAGTLESDAIRVKSLSAQSGDGRITASGFLGLKGYKPENFKITVSARRWPAIATQRYQARLGGDLAVTGTLSTPKIAGQLEITDGTLRPDLAFLEKSNTPPQRDPTIVIVNTGGRRSIDQANPKEKPAAPENDVFKQLALDVRVKIPGNLWLRHPDAVAELAGDLRAKKAAGQEIDLVGTVRIVRGWVGFQGRRFNFTRGEIEFTGGGKINPSLDIVAQHRLPNYTVDAVVGGSATEPTLALRSQPALDQADVLALLLFGRPINGLEQHEKVSLQENAQELATGFVAERIAKSVSETLGLENLGIDIGEVDFSGGRVGFGRYVGRNTYVGVSQELAGERGREVSIEYQVAPNWKIGATGNSNGGSGVDIIWSKQY